MQQISKEGPKFELKDSFLEEYKGDQPDWGPIGYATYKRTYARRLEGDGTEEYWQTVKRVVETTFTIQKQHCKSNNMPWDEEKANETAEEMYDLIWNFKFTPPGRGFWAMDMDILEKKGSAPLNNCGFCSTENIDEDFAEPFCFLMEMSMLGVGIGADTKGAETVTIQEPIVKEGWTFTVPDSREGWVESVKILLNGYGHGGEIPEEFDYSEIRPKGAELKTFGGTASGPQPLIDLHNNIKKLLDKRVGEKIKSSDIVDLFNLAGKCVVAGGIRRTAEVMFGEADDELFLSLKDPDMQTDFWGEEENKHHRWASNNSVFAEVGMDYSDVAERTAKNGEPGYEWLENAKKYGRMKDDPNYDDRRIQGANPCLEQCLEPFELCNLVETYPSNHESLEEWKKTLRYAFLYAKTVTLVPTHNKKTNQVISRNRRIGCSMSGITQAMQKFGRRNFFDACDEGYEEIQKWDEKYSEWLGVPESVKTTSVKPSGTVSLLTGVTSGIHYPVSKYYIKNMRMQEGNPLIDACKEAGYEVEEDMYSDDTMVIKFPVKRDYVQRAEDEVSIWEQVENVAQIQKYWADNQVSVTIKFTEDEKEEIQRILELYEDQVKALSFLPVEDHGYDQAPQVPISEEEYEEIVEDVQPVEEVVGDTHDEDREDEFCSGDTCEVDPDQS